ncbi:MAG: glycosyltransferase family 4 protein [Solirubrobacteraceae bacterium]|nr:glycosyltransferase family 4 protein [Solirubrobacteraceae bacterium]
MAVPVLINARAAARPELGGVERWARELEARLPALRPERYAVARPPAALVHRAGHLWEQVVLPARARHADLLLCPANLAPVASRRTVVVIHDAAALREPEWYSRAYVAWQRAILPRVARRARHVVTVSEFSAEELVSLLGVPRERITVIPGGVDDRFTPGADVAAARVATELDGPYVLTVASRTARKNLGALAATARALEERGIALVAAGGDRPQFSEDAPTGGIRALGHVPDEVLPGLYAGAEAFVLPSLHEGFGLTCVEAMAAGTPVVAADRAALPDTVGTAGLLVDPTDPEAIADAVLRAIGNEPLAAAGRERAAQFTWERTVDAIDALVDSLL